MWRFKESVRNAGSQSKETTNEKKKRSGTCCVTKKSITAEAGMNARILAIVVAHCLLENAH